MKILPEQAVGTAHGKVILIGEHAVVYHMPAIALPFSVARITVTIEPKEGDTTVESAYFTGKLSELPHSLSNFVETLKAACDYLDQSIDSMKIKVSSSIPPERGMGSSAAVASALVRSIFSYHGKHLADEKLFELVSISERIAHGNPSGIDAHIVSSDDPLYYIKGEQPQNLTLNLSGVLIAADTGLKGQTKEAVEDISKLVKKTKRKTMHKIHSLGKLTNKARIAIEQDDSRLLGNILTKAHNYLSDLTVSNEQLDHLINTAMDAGALGAKLTGGGRGGCMIALAESVEQAKVISEELKNAGAVETWIHPLGEDIYE